MRLKNGLGGLTAAAGKVVAAAIATLLAGLAPAKADYRIIHAFGSTQFEGRGRISALTAGPGGVLYGTTESGGRGADDFGFGTIFSMTPPVSPSTEWTYRTLYNFGKRKADGGQEETGARPLGGVLIGPDGALYGTASEGGMGAGTVFRAAPSGDPNAEWNVTVVHDFSWSGDTGAPSAGLTMDASGALYGTTITGGDGGGGGVFKLTPKGGGWKYRLLHGFKPFGKNGSGPYFALTVDSAGVVYGTTTDGGKDNCGLAFSLTPIDGSPNYIYRVIYKFKCGRDGANPSSGLLVYGRVLFGVTSDGGGGGAYPYVTGTAYELFPPTDSQSSWTKSTLHRFNIGGGADRPAGELTIFGGLYGATSEGGGGECNCGTIYKLVYNGKRYEEVLLHAFDKAAVEGASPHGPLLEDEAGRIFGTTDSGGPNDAGVVFVIE